MMVYGYAKDYFYTGDGTLMVKVRIPSIHGPYKQTESQGKKTYTLDSSLPYYPSLLLPHLPNDGEVVLLSTTGSGTSTSNFVILGLTGGSYLSGVTDLEG